MTDKNSNIIDTPMKHQRNIYLEMKPIEEAREIMFDRFNLQVMQKIETVATLDAVDCVLAEPVTAKLSSPAFHAAAMDGYAVKAESTFSATEASPMRLALGQAAIPVNTGHVIPAGCNAVIMIEHVQDIDGTHIEIDKPAIPWQHIRKMGEDIVATELLFPRNHRVTPYCIGALLSSGHLYVKVRKKPRLLIIPTGSEIVDPVVSDMKRTVSLKPGQIIDSNSYVIGALARSYGADYQRHPVVTDDPAKIQTAVEQAVQDPTDIVVIIGGSSAGSEDYTRKVIAAAGDIYIHGVTMMPGKPIIIGAVKGKPVFGLPGYQVSVIVAFEQFVGPLILKLLNQPVPPKPAIDVWPTKKLASKLGLEEFLRVKLGQVGDKIVATPLPRGAGSITTLTKADGIIRIPSHIEGVQAQQPVAAELLRPLEAIRKTIVAVGSHDNTLDILADLIKGADSEITFSSSHVGSLGGLMAIKRGVAHIAGTHLLDAADGSYNTSYVKKYLPDLPVKQIHLVMREQGLIVLPGNPKEIHGVTDLTRNDVTFINRQAGSGTRILLDYKLACHDVTPDRINGYAVEEYTHMSIAAAVLSRSADVGLGIYAAAKALGLDFIPVVTEQYDLIIPEAFYVTKPIQFLLEVIRSNDFKSKVAALGGYHTQRTGTLLNDL